MTADTRVVFHELKHQQITLLHYIKLATYNKKELQGPCVRMKPSDSLGRLHYKVATCKI